LSCTHTPRPRAGWGSRSTSAMQSTSCIRWRGSGRPSGPGATGKYYQVGVQVDAVVLAARVTTCAAVGRSGRRWRCRPGLARWLS
jgi:hypothetical protein